MSSGVRKYRVFVASPGDVAKERQICREVVLSLSQRIGSHGGFVLEPVGWETHADLDLGRPQALINPLVRECDVFIGILWSRFGTETGVAESGTAEEFTEAERVRVESGDRPTMMIFFSDAPVPMDRLLDPDDKAQFEKTVEFRSRYGGLSERYKDVFEFERKLREQLESWCAARFDGSARVPAEADVSGLQAEYLQLVHNFHKDLPVAGFETNLRIPVDLESVFVPVRGRIAGLEHRGQPAELASDDAVRSFDDAWRFAAERDIRLLVILGQPGSGKTTLLKHLALLCARGRAAELGLGSDTVPVFVPLRKLSIDGDPALSLQGASEPGLTGYPPNFFMTALRDGRCLILLDGLDEVADRVQRGEVSRWIDTLAARHARNRIVVTARFAGYRDAQLNAGHLQIDIERFQKEEIEAFLRRWYSVIETRLYGHGPGTLARADQMAGELIAGILEHEEIRVLAANPLMLQIIALVHRDRSALPHRRVELYEECTNVLLEHWDRAKGLDTGLSAREARQILQPLALWMHAQTNRVFAGEQDVAKVIAAPMARLRRSEAPVEFLRSVRDRSGLLTGHGVDEYGFQHLSFQEYLAAEEIRNTRALEILVRHYGESWWREVTRLFAGLGNPNYFDELMRAVVREGKIAAHRSFTADCIRDALQPSADPFVEAIAEEPSLTARMLFSLFSRRRQQRIEAQSAALQVLRGLPTGEVARVADRLRSVVAGTADPTLRRAVELLLVARAMGEQSVTGQVDAATGLAGGRVNAKDGTELVLVAAGTFRCGETLQPNNQPRDMKLPSFYLARYCVTNAQYARYLEEKPNAEKPRYWDDERLNQPEQPVLSVSWDEAVAYCEWSGLRLPTEWEWEKGARGTEGRTYPWGNEAPDETRANFGDKVGQPTPAGSYPAGASPYGLMDMVGNVWEWTGSTYAEERDFKTVRGGAFFDHPGYLRAAYRIGDLPGDRIRLVGFRCAQDP